MVRRLFNNSGKGQTAHVAVENKQRKKSGNLAKRWFSSGRAIRMSSLRQIPIACQVPVTPLGNMTNRSLVPPCHLPPPPLPPSAHSRSSCKPFQLNYPCGVRFISSEACSYPSGTRSSRSLGFTSGRWPPCWSCSCRVTASSRWHCANACIGWVEVGSR